MTESHDEDREGESPDAHRKFDWTDVAGLSLTEPTEDPEEEEEENEKHFESWQY